MAQQIKYLHIDSQLRTNGTFHDFRIEIKPAIFSVQKIKLIALNLPNTYYNVNSSNNIIYFTDGDLNFQAEIPPGVYDILTLPPVIADVMTNGSGFDGNVTVTFDDSTLLLSITATSLISLQFGTFQTNSMATLLGFNLIDTALLLTNTANNIINLSIPSCIFIRINEFSQMCRSTNGYNATFAIYPQGDSGTDTIFFNNATYEMECGHTISLLNQLNISLINPKDGSFYEIDTDWSMMLELIY